eukprot:CAMPEP_0181294822 /NCGR_PEP_ID=MMETSP1101-20121128/3812_1 /TAXON_ID=46948 /ORGANISM="Rhodomonas abbreviata, Strain Caron Lab Isolate" /LENGTH=177 /DNA_ID=CAMNT_0023399519 /DNA_START=201 /DNA_END=730 /DNA_ORIENTATION=+
MVVVLYTSTERQEPSNVLDRKFSLLGESGMPPSPSTSFWKTQQLSYGVPESYGSETVHRMPVRSTDSLGNVLPPIAQEVQPPGYFKVTGEGSLVGNTGPEVHHDEVQPLEVSGQASILPPPPAVTEREATTSSLSPNPNRPVGVHVEDTPQGKVIYYPYMPESAGQDGEGRASLSSG